MKSKSRSSARRDETPSPPPHRFTQEIGEAAHEHAFQAICSPSATDVDHVLVIFPEKLAGAALDVKLLGEGDTPDDPASFEP